MRKTLPKPGRKWSGNAITFLFIFCLCLLASLAAQAQRSVAGRIVSGDDQSPLPGVNILVKGTANGTISDGDGRFSIPVTSENEIIVFSFVGFVSQEMTVGSRTTFDVTLMSDAKQLSEVVVTALGIEKDAATLGYSQQKVSGSDVLKAREPNPLNSLVGKVAGLTVGASSEMLGRPQMVLRGETDVLLVVDGVPVVSDSYNLSPDDIETYNVLKGPNAAALYGSRGRNGAIIITTKKGTKDARGFSIDFNSSTMMEKGFLTMPQVQTDYGPGEYNTYRFGDDRFGQKNGYNQNDYDVWGPRFNGQLISQYDSPYDTATGVRSATPWTARGKNNLDKFLRTGVLSTNNIAIAASGDKYELRASVSQTYQRGIVPNTDLNTSNFNLSGKFKFSDKLSLESNINYNRQYSDNYPDVTYGPNSLIYNINIWAGADWDMNDLKDYWMKGPTGAPLTNIQQRSFEYIRYNNPYFFANEWLRGHHKTDTYGYVALKYDITPWLKASLRTQVTNWDLTRSEKFPFSASAYGRDQKQGDYREDKRSLFDNNTDVMLAIDKDLGADFNISGLIGGNLRTYSYNSSYATTDYLNVPGVYNFGNSKNAVKIYNYSAPMQVGSGYYSFDFGYRQYVTISTTGRLDKYSTFYDGYNTGFYPSIGVSTVISEYLKLPDVISFLKVRGSYANVKSAFTQSTIGPAWQAAGYGNPLEYGDTFTTAYEGPIYNANSYRISRPYNNQPAAYYTTVQANTQLKPSANSSSEVGLDLKVIENRMGLSVTYFQAIKGPSIVTEQWSEASGFQGGLINGIKTEKKGWEITLSGTPVRSESGLTWTTMINWSTYVERYKEFYNGLSSLNGAYLGAGADSRIEYKIGDRVDGLYGTKFYRDNGGNIIHNGDGSLLTDNRIATKLGNYNADFVWSFINTVSYKNFSLNFQFDGRVGGYGIDYVYKKMLQGGSEKSTAEGAYGDARLAEWQANPNNLPPNVKAPTPTYVGPGVALAADSPSPAVDPLTGAITNLSSLHLVPNTVPYSLQNYINAETGFDERTMVSKTFTKLRQVTLTYNFPSAMMSRTAFRAASLSLVGRNLFYFAKRKDIDWEQFIGTNANNQILASPTMRRYGININLTF